MDSARGRDAEVRSDYVRADGSWRRAVSFAFAATSHLHTRLWVCGCVCVWLQLTCCLPLNNMVPAAVSTTWRCTVLDNTRARTSYGGRSICVTNAPLTQPGTNRVTSTTSSIPVSSATLAKGRDAGSLPAGTSGCRCGQQRATTHGCKKRHRCVHVSMNDIVCLCHSACHSGRLTSNQWSYQDLCR